MNLLKMQRSQGKMARVKVAEIFVIQAQQMSNIEQVKYKDEVLDSREEALRENPFAGLFPSLKEAAAHKSSVKEEDVEPGLNVELEPELLDQEVKAWEEKADSEAKCDPKLKAEVVISITNTKVVAGEEIDKCDISFPHEPGAGTMEKATLVKLMSTETRLKCAIKALDSLCNTEVETLNWDKLERISGRLEEHWNRYEVAFTAYKKLFNQYSTAADERFSTLSEAFLAVDQRAWTLFELSVSGGNAKYSLLLEADLEKYSLRIKKVQLDKVEMYMCSKVPLIIDKEGVSSSKPGPEVSSTKVIAVKKRLPGLEKIELKYVHSAKAEAKMDKMQSAQGEAVLLEKIEQGLEEEMFKEEMDLEADKLQAVELIGSRSKEYFAEAAEQPLDFKKLMLRQLNLNTKEVEKHADARHLNYLMKAEAETMVERMHITLEEEPRLKEEKMSRYAIDWHELIADKLVPPGREWSGAEAQASVSSVKVEVISAKDRLDEVEKVWQGSVPLVIDKHDQVEVSLSKAEMRLMMHALKAAAVQFKNTEVEAVQFKLVEEMLMELKACEEEGHEALPLLVDKQAAAAG